MLNIERTRFETAKIQTSDEIAISLAADFMKLSFESDRQKMAWLYERVKDAILAERRACAAIVGAGVQWHPADKFRGGQILVNDSCRILRRNIIERDIELAKSA